MRETGFVNTKLDDPIAFGLLWQINRAMLKLQNHIGMDDRQSWDHANQAVYEISISIEERLMKDHNYDPNTAILSYYYEDHNPHPYRRFH